MAEVKLRALGLREVDFGDFDRYLTALTEDGRRIEILCKNARRGKKQNPAARQLCYSEFILSDRGGRYTLRDADLVHSFFALAGDIEKYALSCYLNELTTALTVPDFDNPALCRLLLYALYALEGGKRDPALVKAAFEWRIMAESGYAPDLTSCGVCGEVIENTPVCFSVRAGTAVRYREYVQFVCLFLLFCNGECALDHHGPVQRTVDFLICHLSNSPKSNRAVARNKISVCLQTVTA